jgi:hypothetical protein
VIAGNNAEGKFIGRRRFWTERNTLTQAEVAVAFLLAKNCIHFSPF